MSLSNTSLKKMVVLVFILVFHVFVQSWAHASTFNTRLEDVYTTERISAYKNAIKYFNSSVADSTAERIAKAIIFYSHKCEIEDDRFVAAVITIESMFNPYAVSRSGAMGLGQLMPGTAQDLSVNQPFNIEQNIHGSCRYLKRQLDRFSHLPRQRQYELTLAAYNAGPGAVQRWGGIPPYQETKNYVVDVINVWRQLCGLNTVERSQLSRMRKRAEEVKKKREKVVKMEITRKYVTTTVDTSEIED